MNRRAFLRGSAAASAALAVPAGLTAGATVASRPTWHRAPCELCSAGCSLLVAVQDGRAVALKADTDAPLNRGTACVRGYHAVQTLYGSDRLTRALIRSNGRLVDASLSSAWDVIAERLSATIAEHGADAVGFYGSGAWSATDAYIAAKLCRAGIGTNNIDTAVRLHDAAARTALAATYGSDGATGSYDDIGHADVFVIWNHNMAETDPVLFSRLLQRRRTSPAVRIITVDTRTTRTSHAADRSLLHAPHTQLALGNAICREIVQRRGVRRGFVDRHVAFVRGVPLAAAGRDDAAASVDLAAFGRFLDEQARTAAPTGVAAEDIRWLASLYADPSLRVLSIWGSELGGQAHAAAVNNVLHNIHLLVGKVATPGSGTLYCSATPNADIVSAAGAAPDALPRGSVSSAEDRARAARLWRVPAERIPAQPGRTALALFRGAGEGAIRFLWVQATDPLSSLPATEKYRRGLVTGRTMLVVTDAYPTATTAAADVVLPAALWLEREAVLGSSDRRLQHAPRLLRAPGAARACGWHMIEVAHRSGYADLFPWPEATHVEQAWSELRHFHEGSGSAVPSLDALRGGHGVQWPWVRGRGTQWRYSTAHDATADAARGAFDFYGQTDGRARVWLRAPEAPAEAPDADYPWWLQSGAVIEHSGTGTLTRRVPSLQRAAPRAWADLNRADAAVLGIGAGQRILLVTRRGSLELEARVEYRSSPPRGTVFVPDFDAAAPVRRLLPDAACPLSGQPQFGGCAVRIERIG